MAAKSMIEWTESTWNPVTGCTKVSSGCDHCYAERFSERFRGVVGHPFEVGFDLTLRPERLEQPKSWRRPRLIFVNSMSDLFHKDIPRSYVHRVFDTMESAHWHTYQVLTKRSSLMRSFVNSRYSKDPVPSHIWLGVSVEDSSALIRIEHLRQSNAVVKFVSFEPLIGPVSAANLAQIDWVIAGGESGPHARPVEIEWLRDLRDKCLHGRVAFFFKQWGGRTPKARGNTLDGQQWMQYPKHVPNSQPQIGAFIAGSPVQEEFRGVMEVGSWAREKLGYLRNYLHAYTTVMNSKAREMKDLRGFFYVDAFAGSGSLKIRKSESMPSEERWLRGLSDYASSRSDEVQQYISGSPRIALELQRPFTDYIFIEIDETKIGRLQQLKHEFDKRNTRIHIHQTECEKYLRDLLNKCNGQWNRWRGLIFLDPFGMQVPWELISMIGHTRSIEVVINFPVGMAINRLLKRSGDFSPKERSKLDEYFGSDGWFKLLYREEDNLFGSNFHKVSEAGDKLVRWYCERLEKEFGYVSPPKEIQTPNGRPLYYLIWAGPNPTGKKIATDILLKQGIRDVPQLQLSI